jgi:N utilization substance protein B
MEASGSAVDRVTREFETHRFGETLDDAEMPEGDVDLFRRVTLEAVNHQARIDQLTDRALVAKWPIARIDPTLRALFRAAGAELVASDVPPKVVITEYLDIADSFYPRAARRPSSTACSTTWPARRARRRSARRSGGRVAGTAATVWVTFPEDLCVQVDAGNQAKT